MKNKIIKALLMMMIACGLGIGANSYAQSTTKTPVKTNVAAPIKAPAKAPAIIKQNTASTIQAPVYETVNAVDVVNNPSKYLHKHIKIKAKFDKFTTLGLDYKPAFRSSEKYITFLIKRENVANHNMPLSEMKIFLNRIEAEKHIDLSSGDEIEFSGIVFSNALGDPWVDVEKITVLTVKPKETDKK